MPTPLFCSDRSSVPIFSLTEFSPATMFLAPHRLFADIAMSMASGNEFLDGTSMIHNWRGSAIEVV